MVSIGQLVRQVSEKVRVEKDNEYKMVGVKWYGEGTFHRETVTGTETSATYLMPVVPNAFIYNRLFAWKESFAVVPSEHKGHFVSAEFPQFIVDESRLLPLYLYLFFTLDSTIQAVNAASIGSAAVSRNRFKENEFLGFEIPLPPLETQQAIVARWQQAQAEIAATNGRVKHLEATLLLQVKEALGRKKNGSAKQPKVFALQWKDLDRWGVEMSWKAQTRPHVAKYRMVRVGDLCKISSGGTPSRKNPAYFGGDISWVKTTEVRDSIILETEETITQLGLENSSAKVYPNGSLIVAMYGQGATRGRTAKLGIEAATNQACAVLTDFSEQIETDYLWYYLMSEYEDLRGLASGNNQPNLNAAMIANYFIPLPPLNVQRDIMRRVEAGRAEIARERESAQRWAREVEAEVEALILGTRKL